MSKERYQITIQRGMGRPETTHFIKQFRSKNDETAKVGAKKIFSREKEWSKGAREGYQPTSIIRLERFCRRGAMALIALD